MGRTNEGRAREATRKRAAAASWPSRATSPRRHSKLSPATVEAVANRAIALLYAAEAAGALALPVRAEHCTCVWCVGEEGRQ